MTTNVKGKAMTTDEKGKTKATDAKGKTKATGLKEFLLNLATDPRKLGEFLHEPEDAMSAANLSEADKIALRSGVAGMVAARLAGVPLGQAFMLLVYQKVAAYMIHNQMAPMVGPQQVAPYVVGPMVGPQQVAPYLIHTQQVAPQYVVQPPPQYVVYPPQYVVQPPPQYVVQPPPQYVVYPPQFVVQPPPYYPR
jgi:hypothetical protein